MQIIIWGNVGPRKTPDIEQRIDAWGRFERWGESDRFLSEVVWPLVAGQVICHDSTDRFGDARPFPEHPPLAGTCFVGEIVPVDRPPLDTWREIGVLRDQIVTLHGEIARRDAEIAAAQAEIARQVAVREAAERDLAERARHVCPPPPPLPAPPPSWLRRAWQGLGRRPR